MAATVLAPPGGGQHLPAAAPYLSSAAPQLLAAAPARIARFQQTRTKIVVPRFLVLVATRPASAPPRLFPTKTVDSRRTGSHAERCPGSMIPSVLMLHVRMPP